MTSCGPPRPGRTVRAVLPAAVAADPARPLLTFYDDSTHERTELSVATFGTWVAKTANLLVDGLGAAPGDRVALQLPVHWQAAVWLGACWETGLVAAPGADRAEIAVVAAGQVAGGQPGAPAPALPEADEVVSLGLGPLGLPRRDLAPPPSATLDYDREVAAYGDRFAGHPPDAPEAPALQLGGTVVTSGELGEHTAAALARWAVPPRGRILCAGPYSDLRAVLTGLLVPLAGAATAVLVRHLDPALAPARMQQEGIVAASGLAPDVLPELPRLI